MQNDKYRIDSHKLIYHPGRVADWINGVNIYPIYMEISPTGMCNLRCIFCSVDFMGYQNRSLDSSILKERLTEFGKLGIKSIMYAGEGEPFLHKDMAAIIRHTHDSGIDAAVTTNGILMKPDILENILGVTKWIKVSCNAGSPETYAAIHRTEPKHFSIVLDNLRNAEAIRKEKGFFCTLGIQILLLPENEHEVFELAAVSRDIGLDYIVIKPYTRHYRNTHEFDIEYDRYNHLAQKLQQLNTDTFSAVFRAQTMRKWDSGVRQYAKCLALPFWSYIDAGGNVWGCSSHLEDERFLYGNINNQTFQKIWEGKKRLESLQWVSENLSITKCKLNCRMDEINLFLDELTNPIEHVNFI